MAKKREEDGVWRTIGGRHVFIRNGESIEDAMRNSGKFPSAKSKNGKVEEVASATKKKDWAKGFQNKLDDLKDEIGTDDKKDKKHWAKGYQNRLDDLKEETNDDFDEKEYSKRFYTGGGYQDADKLMKDWAKSKEELGDEVGKIKLDTNIPSNTKKVSKEEVAKERDYWLNKSNESGSSKPMNYDEFEKKIREIQDRPTYKEKMDQAVKDLEKKYNGESSSKPKLTDRDVKDLFKQLNDEGSDFSFGDTTIEDGKIKTDVGVFMPDDRGYTTRDLEIPINDDDDYNSLEEKMRDWQSRHSTPDSFEYNDFDDDTQKEYKNYTSDLGIDPNKKSSKDRFMKDYAQHKIDTGTSVANIEEETNKARKSLGKPKSSGFTMQELSENIRKHELAEQNGEVTKALNEARKSSGPSKEQRAKMHELAEQVRNDKKDTINDNDLYQKDQALRKEEDKLLSSYKPSEKQRNKIHKMAEELRNETKSKGYDISNNYRDRIKSQEPTRDASYELTSDDPNRYGDKMRKVNDFNKREEEESSKRTDERYKYSQMDNYEIYDKADKLASETDDYELKDKIRKNLDKIDRANKRGEGYAEKPTNALRELLAMNSYETNKETPKTARETMNDGVDDEIKSRFGTDGGYDDDDYQKNLKEQIDSMRYPNESIQQTAERLVRGGDFRIYNDDVKDYLDQNGVKYDDDNFFDMYAKHMGNKITKLYNQKPKYKGNMKPEYGSQKSFYGKANSTDNRDGSKTLTSYDTDIMNIKNGKIKMLCEKKDLTNTTLRHIKEFLQQNGLDPMKKKDLVELIEKGESKTLDAVKDARSSMKSEQAYKNAYEKYMKDHPNSKLSFEEYKKIIR